MKTKLINIALASVFAFAASSASADDVAYTGSWYVMPGLGLLHTDSDLKADDDSTSYFFRVGKEVSEHWDVQIGGSYGRPEEDDAAFTSGHYKQTLFGVDALYMLSRDNFRPFLLAGVGVARNKIDYEPGNVGDSKTSWMANLGAGFQYHFNEVVALQADIRHQRELLRAAASRATVPAPAVHGGGAGRLSSCQSRARGNPMSLREPPQMAA